jgi:hypothetical protein
MKYSRATFIAVLCGVITLTLNAPGRSAGAAEIPPELVGAWTHIEWQANDGHYDPDKVDQFDYRNQDPVGWTDAYRFFSDGSYQHAHFTSLDIPGCDAKTLRQERGWFHLVGESVNFENRIARISAQGPLPPREQLRGTTGQAERSSHSEMAAGEESKRTISPSAQKQ